MSFSERIARPAAEHVVAIGDLHGDLEATRKALRLAGAIDASDHWSGGSLVVVQTGDEIDRGDDDRKILDLFDRLRDEARAAGGAVIALLGNHEVMNVALDFRYVTPGGFAAFADVRPSPAQGSALMGLSEAERPRGAAFVQGGLYARRLATRPLVMKVGDTVFVHGGVLPKHVAYGLDKMNDELHAWMLGERRTPPAVIVAEDGPIWTRAYSGTAGTEDCKQLGEALAAMGAKRMVVGHTPQTQGVTSACDEKVWRIDVGMARFYGGPVQDLDVDKGAVHVKK